MYISCLYLFPKRTSHNLSFANERNPFVSPSSAANEKKLSPATASDDPPPTHPRQRPLYEPMPATASAFDSITSLEDLSREQRDTIMANYYSKGAASLASGVERLSPDENIVIYRARHAGSTAKTIIKIDDRGDDRKVTITKPGADQ